MGPERKYVSLDDEDTFRLAKDDPAHFFEIYPPPVLIDEVQRVPSLFMRIKKIVDESDARGQIWLTGSHVFHLMRNVSESLAGRVAVLNLQGFSQAEKNEDQDRPPFLPNIPLKVKRPILHKQEIFATIVKGSYPQLFDGSDWEMFYSSYISSYLHRDIYDVLRVSDLSVFHKFLKIMASRTGQILNYADIGRDVEITAPTARSWTSILETCGLIYLLHPYSRNLGQRAKRRPKFYFMDTGLCCYLNGLTNAQMALASPISGALFETYVVSEILKSYFHHGKVPQVYFYFDTYARAEIDLLIEQEGKIWPVEVKLSSTPQPRMAKNFELLAPAQRGKGAIICTADKFIPLNPRVMIIPASYI